MVAPKLTQTSSERRAQAAALANFLAAGPTAVLTGAGCSTESGIPDYRGPQTRKRVRSPVRFMQFIQSPQSRRRYWARAMVGWSRFSDKRPNQAHVALAQLERAGWIAGVVTQNVDDLHEHAGSQRVIALHGSLSEVRCLDCGDVSPRARLQARLHESNPEFRSQLAELAPDGDAELSDDLVERFVVADCERCGGALKPRVVFFGENVPRPRLADALALCDGAERLLVVGSSLEVFSGYRFVRRAAAQGQPIAIVNLGATRGDADAALRVEALAGRILPDAVEHLTTRFPGGLPSPEPSRGSERSSR